MCVIIAGLGGKLPDLDYLERGAWSNPDGFGFGVVFETRNGVKIATGRTMEEGRGVTALHDKVNALGADRVLAWAWHARIATHGAVDVSGCHPHAITGEPKTVLFHNGILPVKARGALSDTATFAADILPAMGGTAALLEPHVLNMVEDWSKGSKLVFLSSDPDLGPLNIIHEGAGYWSGGFWFSNSSCEPRKARGYYSGGWFADDLDYGVALAPGVEPVPEVEGVVSCPWCWESVDLDVSSVCELCRCCLLCEAYADDCGCYEVEGFEVEVEGVEA